jgi:hypothetical protein
MWEKVMNIGHMFIFSGPYLKNVPQKHGVKEKY